MPRAAIVAPSHGDWRLPASAFSVRWRRSYAGWRCAKTEALLFGCVLRPTFAHGVRVLGVNVAGIYLIGLLGDRLPGTARVARASGGLIGNRAQRGQHFHQMRAALHAPEAYSDFAPPACDNAHAFEQFEVGRDVTANRIRSFFRDGL